ncbi:MAG: RecX family transcriptional regulator [Thermomicrobiales bacterium]
MTFKSHEPDNDRDSTESEPSVLPGTITRLTEQRRSKGRVWVELDGRSGLSVTADVVASAGLAVGDYLDDQAIARLRGADELERATQAALAFLAYRPRSEREVRDRLRRGQYDDDVIAAVLERLYDWRYLDDEDFARRWVANRTTDHPRGRRLLQQELWRKGIDRDVARDAIEDAEIDEDAAAETLAKARLAAYAGEEPAVVRRRLGAYLARRGYGYDVVKRALDRVMDETEESIANLDD